jgi:hypothetical protein
VALGGEAPARRREEWWRKGLSELFLTEVRYAERNLGVGTYKGQRGFHELA